MVIAKSKIDIRLRQFPTAYWKYLLGTALFGLGAHPFLTLTLFIAMFERDHGPLEYQLAYGRALQHLSLPYPDIAT